MEKEVKIHNDESKVGTVIIANKFKREHFQVLRLIKKYEHDFLDLGSRKPCDSLIIRRVQTKRAGRPSNEIMLNKQQVTFLGTLLRNTQEVVEFKKRCAEEL